jgi:hypothetical protein
LACCFAHASRMLVRRAIARARVDDFAEQCRMLYLRACVVYASPSIMML